VRIQFSKDASTQSNSSRSVDLIVVVGVRVELKGLSSMGTIWYLTNVRHPGSLSVFEKWLLRNGIKGCEQQIRKWIKSDQGKQSRLYVFLKSC
jgi:hypothetical protein